jgi:hypothetical protein
VEERLDVIELQEEFVLNPVDPCDPVIPSNVFAVVHHVRASVVQSVELKMQHAYGDC